MQHSADARLDGLLNSAGFRAELGAWLAACDLAFTDIDHFRLTRDEQTGHQLIVAELTDGRQRAFPFTSHRVH